MRLAGYFGLLALRVVWLGNANLKFKCAKLRV